MHTQNTTKTKRYTRNTKHVLCVCVCSPSCSPFSFLINAYSTLFRHIGFLLDSNVQYVGVPFFFFLFPNFERMMIGWFDRVLLLLLFRWILGFLYWLRRDPLYTCNTNAEACKLKQFNICLWCWITFVILSSSSASASPSAHFQQKQRVWNKFEIICTLNSFEASTMSLVDGVPSDKSNIYFHASFHTICHLSVAAYISPFLLSATRWICINTNSNFRLSTFRKCQNAGSNHTPFVFITSFWNV